MARKSATRASAPVAPVACAAEAALIVGDGFDAVRRKVARRFVDETAVVVKPVQGQQHRLARGMRLVTP
jgi:hypothetical protein